MNEFVRVPRTAYSMVGLMAFVMWSIMMDGRVQAQAPQVPIRDLIDTNQDPSYITAAGGINFGNGVGAFKDQIFEADINQHLRWYEHATLIFPWHGSVRVNPRIILRMTSEESSPVRTPSFMPRLTYVFWFTDSATISKSENFFYGSLMVSHHSNGQAGSFYTPDSVINRTDGSFSTNFIELAWNQVWGISWMPSWTKIAVEWHPGFNRAEELKDQYETWKVIAAARNMNLPGIPYRYDIKFATTVSYVLAGRKYIVAPNRAVRTSLVKKAKTMDNLSLSMKLSYRPKFTFCGIPVEWEDVNIFAKYDHGYDYYNMNFFRRINRIQIGLATDPSNFVNLKTRSKKSDQ